MKFVMTKLQSAVFFELQKESNVHGYELLKRISEKGIVFSHQQLYRDLNRMPLDMVIEQQDGKPDRKYYTLREDVLYTHNIAKMDVYFLLGYKRPDLISQKIDYINDESERLAKMPLSLIGQMRIDSNNLALHYLVTAMQGATNA